MDEEHARQSLDAIETYAHNFVGHVPATQKAWARAMGPLCDDCWAEYKGDLFGIYEQT
jgi:hypothetical protein